MALTVAVWSPHRTIAEGVACLVRSLGHRAVVLDRVPGRAEVDVAVWDLTSASPPYPVPGPVPTLALFRGGERARVRLLALGYRGYLLPEHDGTLLDRAIRAVVSGEVWAERKVLAQRTPFRTLTPREREVMDLLVRGLTNREIAQILRISEKTVSVHVSSLLRKYEARSRLELLVKAAEERIA